MNTVLRPLVLATLLLGLAAPSAQACRHAGLHTYTFFIKLREEVLDSERVAKIRILNTQVGNIGGHITMVQVIKPLKGLRQGDVFFVLSSRSSCEQDHRIPIGGEFFIAGDFDRGLFAGTWKREEGLLRRIEPPI